VAAKTPTLVQFDRELRDRLDRHAAEWCGGNRSRAVHEACELLLASHAAWRREQQPPTFPGHDPGGVRHTADRESELRDRPLTADLTREFGGGRWSS
jgi:hypothetical protein